MSRDITVEINNLIEKYEEDNNYTDYLKSLKESLDSPEVIIPFLGTQGAGKSTMLNSFLGEELLPNEADETTCIPVEIRYGNEETIVYFKDGRQEIVESTKEAITEYVDNNYNAGNEKAVSHIVISKKLEALKNGLTVVDLPGVGSMTKENEQTTLNYLKKMSAAVFVITTTPPILKKNATFIKNTWRGINSAFFVQNRWDGDSDDELNEGLNHNKKILTNIAEEISVPFDGKIIPVNAYAAAKGVNDRNDSLIMKSNIQELKESLFDFSENYVATSENNYEEHVKQIINQIINEIKVRIDNSHLSQDELIAELRKQRNQYEDVFDEIKDSARRIDDKIYDDKKELKKFANDLAFEKAGHLKTELFKIIDSGIVDGEKLSKAFEDIQNQCIDEACDEAYEKIEAFCDELMFDYEEMTISVEKNQAKTDTIHFEKKEKLKWEKGAGFGMMLGADVAAFIVGAKAGAGIGAAIGTAGGPAGTVIGAVAGLAIGLAISLVGVGTGTLFRKGVNKVRGIDTKEEIRIHVDEFEKTTKDVLIKYGNECFDIISASVNNYLNMRKKELEQIDARIIEVRKQSEKAYISEDELCKDLEVLKGWIVND